MRSANTLFPKSKSPAANLNASLSRNISSVESQRPSDGRSSSDSHFQPPEFLSISGLNFSALRIFFFCILSIVSIGILPLICKWYPKLWVLLVRRQAQSFRVADYVLLEGNDGKWFEEKVVVVHDVVVIDEYNDLDHSFKSSRSGVRYFEFRKLRYVYHEQYQCFQRLNVKLDLSFAEIHQMRSGLSTPKANALLRRNGLNKIDITQISIWKMLLDKIFHPFYIFQVASAFNVGFEIHTAKKQENNLRAMVKSSWNVPVAVIRDSKLISVKSEELVVGDVVVLDTTTKNLQDTMIMGDLVLLSGEVICDESSLSGESVPITKSALPILESSGEPLSLEKHKEHILFGGSLIVQVRMKNVANLPRISYHENDICNDKVIAIVTATGFES
ncbi:hypothetical protein HK096_011165, partial [Nowakowskiella sp. JEL0078]